MFMISTMRKYFGMLIHIRFFSLRLSWGIKQTWVDKGEIYIYSRTGRDGGSRATSTNEKPSTHKKNLFIFTTPEFVLIKKKETTLATIINKRIIENL